MGVNSPTKHTPLFLDMELAVEMLHQTHEEFLRLPEIERKKLRLYFRVKKEKEIYWQKQMKFSNSMDMNDAPKAI